MPTETRRRSVSRREDPSPLRRHGQPIPASPAPRPFGPSQILASLGPTPSRESSNTTHRANPKHSREQKLERDEDLTPHSLPDSWLADAAANYILYEDAANNTNVYRARKASSNKNASVSLMPNPNPNPPLPHIPTSSSSTHRPRLASIDPVSTSRSRSSSHRSHLQPSSSNSQSQASYSHIQTRNPPALHASSSSPNAAAVSRKATLSGGNSSDGGSTPITGPRFDMKRLLSKPAAPSHSGSSIISVPSDSEPSSASPSTSRTPLSAASREDFRIGKQDYGQGRDGSYTEDTYRSTRLASPSGRHAESSRPRVGSSRESSTSAPLQKSQHRSFHLEAKPNGGSSSRLDPASPTTVKSFGAATMRRTAVPALTIDSSYRSRPVTSPADKSTGKSAGSRPVTSPADKSIGRAAGRSFRASNSGGKKSDPDSPALVGLTPAGALAHAYKQQEQRRDQLTYVTREDDSVSRRNISKSRSMDLGRDPDGGENEKSSPAPYYTVFGSTSGKVVAVGGPEDYTWTYERRGLNDSSRSKSGSASTSVSNMKVISRKMSQRWKKVGGGTRSEFSPDGSDRGHGEGENRPTLQDRRSASLPKETRKSLRLDMDEPFERAVPEPLRTGRSTYSTRHGMVPKWLRDDGARISREDGEESPLGSMGGKSIKSKDGRRLQKEREREDDMSPGGKLWKLMKRISTGGLRDKYNSYDASPPPVPALPKDVAYPSPGKSVDGHGSSEQGVLSRFIQSRPSMSVGRPTTGRTSGSPTKTIPNTPMSAPRPSTTTISSSPVSSTDIASSRFFQRPQSARSSSSSYVEEMPPVPNSKVGQHIIPPNELYKLNGEKESLMLQKGQGASMATGDHRPNTHDDVVRSLPCPPRRPGSSGKGNVPSSAQRPHSPDIPAFSTSDPVNFFATWKSSSNPADSSSRPSPVSASAIPQSEFGVSPVSPPRRPVKSQKRSATSTSSSFFNSPLSGTMGPSTLPSFTFTSTDDASFLSRSTEQQSHRDRDSYDAISNASTTKARQRSDSFASSSDSQDQSPLMFREFGDSVQPWSEKEKAEKWDDLLERSARAGGTIHIGGEGLMSDNIRFSTYSET